MIATIPSEATPGIESGHLNTPLECRRHRSRHHRPFYFLACSRLYAVFSQHAQPGDHECGDCGFTNGLSPG